MRIKVAGLVLSLALLVIVLVGSCANVMPVNTNIDSTLSTAQSIFDSTTTVTTIQINEDAEAAIYATVIRQIYTHDDSFGGKLQPSILYVRDYTDDKSDDPVTSKSNSKSIPTPVQTAVLIMLQDLPTELNWAIRNDTRTPFITLGNIYQQQDGTMQIACSLYVGNLGAQGQTYILRYEISSWKITGKTGPVWIA